MAIDVWSGEQRIVAHLDERSVWPCLAVDPTTNLLYAAGANRRREQIVSIDAHSGAIRVAATLDRPVMALAFSPQGKAYVILPRLFESGAGMTLCTVDLAAGSVQEIARIQGVDSISGLAFEPDGRLWAVARKKGPDPGPFVTSLDPATGVILWSARMKSMVSDIACTPDGRIYGTDGPYLVFVSPEGYTHDMGKGEVGALWGLAVMRVD